MANIEHKEIYKKIEEAGYTEQAKIFLDYTNVRIDKIYSHTGKHFNDGKVPQDIYNITIYRGNKSFTFQYGDSIHNTEARIKSGKRKTVSDYNILSCLTKSDPGNIQDFMDEYGYNIDSKKDSKLYEDVCDEYNKLRVLFTVRELELMQLIQ